MFAPAGGFTAYNGYYGACKRPIENSIIVRYRICQGILCVLWIIFSIIRDGSFDGFTRIGMLNDYKEAVAKFCILLVLLLSHGYIIFFCLGLYGIIKIGTVIICLRIDQ